VCVVLLMTMRVDRTPSGVACALLWLSTMPHPPPSSRTLSRRPYSCGYCGDRCVSGTDDGPSIQDEECASKWVWTVYMCASPDAATFEDYKGNKVKMPVIITPPDEVSGPLVGSVCLVRWPCCLGAAAAAVGGCWCGGASSGGSFADMS
jgi:hypothetical protein